MMSEKSVVVVLQAEHILDSMMDQLPDLDVQIDGFSYSGYNNKIEDVEWHFKKCRDNFELTLELIDIPGVISVDEYEETVKVLQDKIKLLEQQVNVVPVKKKTWKTMWL
jgi:hypothetical protein